MRLSQFQELMADEFGEAHAAVLLNDLVLLPLGEKTGRAAIDAGADPKDVWLAICAAMDVPKDRWHGKAKKNKKSN